MRVFGIILFLFPVYLLTTGALSTWIGFALNQNASGSSASGSSASGSSPMAGGIP